MVLKPISRIPSAAVKRFFQFLGVLEMSSKKIIKENGDDFPETVTLAAAG